MMLVASIFLGLDVAFVFQWQAMSGEVQGLYSLKLLFISGSKWALLLSLWTDSDSHLHEYTKRASTILTKPHLETPWANFNSEMVDYAVALFTFVGSFESTYRPFFFYLLEARTRAQSFFSTQKESLVISWILVVYRNLRSILLLWNGSNINKLIWYDCVSTVTQFSIYPFRKRWSRSSQFFLHSPRWEKVSRQNDVEFFHWTLVDIWFCARFFVFSMASFVFRCQVFK